jgi:flagellar hook assembly protein FlgD
VEFLRDENDSPSPHIGDQLYDAWAATGKAAPVVMAHDTISVTLDLTGVKGDGPRTITALDQNFPNPFNPSTTVRYSLKSREHVNITVYDVRGSVVRVLVDEERPAGYQKIDWYGQNQSDERVASGIYFIRMTTADRQLVRKAVLLK